jgi:phospholipid transport system substrate-binding protein
MSPRPVCLLCLLPLLASRGVAEAAPPKPTPFMEAQITTVRALIATPAKPGSPEATSVDGRLRGLVDTVMEFERLSEKALGKHWPTLSAEQRKTFIGTFRDLVYRSYLKKVRGANEAYTVAFEGEKQAPDARSARVEAVAKTKTAEIELVFFLEQRDDSRWVAADINIDEVSLVENYREQFNRIITKDGFGVLIDKMKKKLAEL